MVEPHAAVNCPWHSNLPTLWTVDLPLADLKHPDRRSRMRFTASGFRKNRGATQISSDHFRSPPRASFTLHEKESDHRSEFGRTTFARWTHETLCVLGEIGVIQQKNA